MSPRVVHLLRHGEVENPGRVTYGRLPGFSLSSNGRAQVARAAAYLSGQVEAPISIVTSPLERARETAEIIRAELASDADIRVDPRLIESGSWREGLPRRFDLGRYLVRWLDGTARAKSEAPRAVALRMRAAVLDALAAQPDGAIVLVSHQLPIWMGRAAFEQRFQTDREPFAARYFPLAFVRERCEPASVTSLSLHGADLRGVAYWDGREPAGSPP